MKIRTDENGYVVGFVTIGDMTGAEPYDGVVPEDFTSDCRYYRLENNILVFDKNKKTQEEQSKINIQRIAELKEALAQTDYMITKSYEYSIVGELIPYDISTLHEERQSLRNEINLLENSG